MELKNKNIFTEYLFEFASEDDNTCYKHWKNLKTLLRYYKIESRGYDGIYEVINNK